MEYFQSQNKKLESGVLNGTHAKPLHLDTLGLTNACIDLQIEAPFYPEYAFNNTYGLQTIPEEVYVQALNNLTKTGGCQDLIDECRSLTASSDPENVGANEQVNTACSKATEYCFNYVQGAYMALSGVSAARGSRLAYADMPRSVIHLIFRGTSLLPSHRSMW